MNNPKNAAAQKRPLKRFYKEVSAVETHDGWQVLLDGKPIRTPAKALLMLPTQKLAQAVASEWERQGDEVDLDTMHLMQFSCAAIDYTQAFRADVLAETHDYITTDLLCYRAQEPQELVKQQSEQWNPWVQWAEKRFAIKLVMVAGIMPSPQSEQTLRALKARLAMLDDFPLTAVWMMAKYTGSLLLALALWERAIAVDDAFAASRLEETFQNSQWGEDEEAARRRDATAVEMTILAEFISLIQ